jgi:hypothetical protein
MVPMEPMEQMVLTEPTEPTEPMEQTEHLVLMERMALMVKTELKDLRVQMERL